MELQINLFDHLLVSAGADRATVALRSRSQRLLAYLLLQRRHALPRAQVAFTLWPDTREDEALGVLRRALSDLRAALPDIAGRDWILSGNGQLRWNPDAPGRLDIDVFEALVQQGTPQALHDAVELYHGDLLATWDDEWLPAERERLRQLQLGALRSLSAHHHALGNLDAAMTYARRARQHDPLSEAVYRDLMTLYASAGERATALATYDQLSALLREELDIEPMPETRALRDAIARGAPALDTAGQASGTPPSPTPGARPVPELIGRDDESAFLRALWADAAAGRGQLAIVSGEAGIGKSHLVRSLASEVAGGELALTGHCYALERALPYQPIVEMLRAAQLKLRHAGLAPAYRAALARLAPDVVGVADSPAEIANDPAVDSRLHLFEALFQAFRALARGQPLLMVLEDLHRADDATLDWLASIAPRLDGNRILVIITYRTDEVDSSHALNRLRRRLAREGVVATLALQPLSIGGVHRIVADLSGLPDETVKPIGERLHYETGGNPFFLHEIVRGLLESGQLVAGAGRWEGPFITAGENAQLPLPESLRETIRTRAGRLTEMALSFLAAASVAGHIFSYHLVREAGAWRDEFALNALEDLLARSFVRASERNGQYVFAHHLVREVVYADMTAPRREYWHRRVARALERHASRTTAAEQHAIAGQIVHHAERGNEYALLFQWAPVAAEQASARYAYADALRLLELSSAALEQLRHEPGFDLTRAERQHIDVLLQRSQIMPHVGRSVEEHGQVLQQVAALLERYPDEQQQATFELRQSDYLADQRQYAQSAEAARRASARCLALGDARGAARGLHQAGTSLITISRNAAAIQAFEEALEIFRSSGDASGEVLSLSGLAWANIGLGRFETAFAHLRHALALSEERGDPLGIARSCYVMAAAWSFYYQADQVRYYAERSEQLYREIGYVWTAYRAQFFSAAALMLAGDLERSRALLEHVADNAREIEDSWLEGWATHLLGRLALNDGELPAAEQHLTRASHLHQVSGELQNQVVDLVWLARLRLAQGEAGEALALTQQAITQLDALSGEAFVWELPGVPFAHAEMLAATGNGPAAQPFLDRAYDTLMDFAAQITDAELRAAFLAYPLNARIIAARDAAGRARTSS